MNEAGPSQRLYRWLDQRYKIAPLADFLREKEVPLGTHPLFWYFLGGTTLFFFSIQIVTGVLLAFYYQPSSQTAYESVRFITEEAAYGWFLRGIHKWAAIL